MDLKLAGDADLYVNPSQTISLYLPKDQQI